MADLARSLAALGLSSPPAKQPDTYPELNPLDVYRAHIAEELAPLAGVEAKIVLAAIQRTVTPEQGDLVVPVPALRIKGVKPAELAVKLAAQFPETPLLEKPTADQNWVRFRF